MNVSKGIIRWFFSFLTNRNQILKIPNSESSFVISNNNGVPQGSVLGGLVFVITTNKIGMNSHNRYKFVDDMSLVISSNEDSLSLKVNTTLKDISSQSKQQNMILNLSKTTFMVHSSFSKESSLDIDLDGVSIENSRSCKILGIIIQHDLKWTDHVHYMISKANKRIFMMYRLKKLGLSTQSLTQMYKSFIRPILEYNSVVWSESLTIRLKKDLERIQKRIVKIIIGDWNIDYNIALSQLNLESLEERRTNALVKFAHVFFKQFPHYLPKARIDQSNHYTRQSNQHFIPYIRTQKFANSTIPTMLRTLNESIY